MIKVRIFFVLFIIKNVGLVLMLFSFRTKNLIL